MEEFTKACSRVKGASSNRDAEKLCNNCDAKPVFTAKTDFIDKTSLLILRNLLKTKNGLKIPAYRSTRAQGRRSL